MRLKDKVIVITGSTRGIGRAIAKACASEGAKVVISSREESKLKKTCEQFKLQGFAVSGIAVDISKPEDIEKLLGHAVETFKKVDVWINNAGLSGGYRYLDEFSEEELSQIINVNFTGTLDACRIIIPYFIKQGGGILLNMTGKGGGGKASPYMTTYAATKAAVTSLTKSLAKEYKDYPISINAVSPGMVETDFYKDIKISLKLCKNMKTIPYILKAFNIKPEDVGNYVVGLAAAKPGKVSGKVYSLVKGKRLLRFMAFMIYFKVTGKLK